MFSKLLKGPGPRPPFYEVVAHVFGADHDVDTDGDSHVRDSPSWTELYVESRENRLLKLEIEPTSLEPLVLRISGSMAALVESASRYLVECSGGELTD